MQQQHYAYSSWTWRDFRLRSATLSAPSWTYIMLMPSVYKKPMSTLMWQTVFLSLALISSASTYIPSMVELCMLVRTWQVLLTSFQQLTATLSRLVLSLLPMSTVLLANHGQNTTCFHPFHIPRSMWVTLTARCRGWEQWFAAGPWFKAKRYLRVCSSAMWIFSRPLSGVLHLWPPTASSWANTEALNSVATVPKCNVLLFYEEKYI